jgi:Tol biopolymer transport system component
VIYTDLDADLRYQLFVVPVSGGEPEQITTEREGIWSFSVAPDGDTVIYATPDGSNGTRLWALVPETAERRLFMACPGLYCSGVFWSPDGRGLLYSRLDSAAQGNVTGITSLWWYNLTTNETAPLFQDANMPGFNPRWSPDGKWLSYTSINPQQIQIYQVETGERLTLPTQTGAPAVWSPDGETLLLVDIQQVGENYLPKIFHYNLLDRQLTPLNVDHAFDDNYPSWSPDGEWIVMVRRDWSTGVPVRGNQVWLIRPDGSEAHPVTADHEVIHGQPAWSPDGRYLLYDVDSASTTELDSGINILDLETGEVLDIAPSGNRSTWLP